MMKNKIIIVAGLTASGKTDYAIRLADQINGELINADSRQIYRHLDIGTNKGEIFQTSELDSLILEDKKIDIPVSQIKNIKIHLIDFLDIDKRFSVYEFQAYAFQIIDKILNEGKTPIIVGGTGMYIDSIVSGYKLENNNGASKDRILLESKNIVELQKILKEKSNSLYKSLNESDIWNPRRLVRLIEKSDVSNSDKIKLPSYEIEFLYMDYEWENLKQKIEKRVRQMFDDGLLEEAEKFRKLYPDESPGFTSSGYKIIFEYLDKQINLEECIQKIIYSHINYARRQRTWFERGNRNYNLTKIYKL